MFALQVDVEAHGTPPTEDDLAYASLRIAELLCTLNIRVANIYTNTSPPPRTAKPVTSTASAPKRPVSIHPISINQPSHNTTKLANTMGVQDASDIVVASTALIDLIRGGM
jgi:hypothetical protein